MDRIEKVEVYLAGVKAKGGLADATRKIGMVGFTIICITTKQGVTGYGITYHEVGGSAVKAMVMDDIAPALIGRDPFETETLWQEMFHYLRGVGRKGLSFCAMSAVDTALWDIKGKILGLPLYRLLGGNKKRIPIYASGGWTSYNLDELLNEVHEMISKGYKAIKIKVGVKNGGDPRADIERIRRVRREIGEDIVLMLDANNCWDAATAVQFANNVKDCNIKFFEEPVAADDIPGLVRFKNGTDIPLATGEHEYTKYGVRDLMVAGAADILQIDAARCGGITESLKIAAIAQAWNIPYAPHSMEYIHMHLVSACPNGTYLERLLLFEELVHSVYKDPPQPQNGYLEIPDKPGLGIELNMDFIKENNPR